MTQAWQPTAPIETLRLRAKLITQIRAFFAEREVLEVETPLLSHASITDPHIQAIPALFQGYGNTPQTIFLQTSPEYAMKRLLAADIGSIYQICKAFRQDDPGHLHNPEFTILEWYRLGFNHHDLMQELDELLQCLLKTKPAVSLTYQQLFEHYLTINPHNTTINELSNCAARHDIAITSDLADRDAWLSLLLTHVIEPQLGLEQPTFIYDFPESQAALAKIRQEDPPVASRFELYFKGIELANGFHELLNESEQRKRFNADLVYRKQHHLPLVPLDERFLAALESGLPDCAGVAVGIDRLIMLALECQTITNVISFSFNQA